MPSALPVLMNPDFVGLDGVPSVLDLRQDKLQSDEKVLAELENQVAHFETTTSSLTESIHKLQTALAISQRNLAAATLQRDALLADVLAQRASFPLDRIPNELLLPSFEALVAPGPSLSTLAAPERVDRRRALAPFVIAAVCQDWRNVALRTPRLWHYISIPQLPKSGLHGSTFVAYVQAVLDRSQSTELDITFELMDAAGGEYLSHILELLSAHTKRWRLFSARMKDRQPFSYLLNHLRGPVPALVSLSIAWRPSDVEQTLAWGDWSLPLPKYLT